MTRSFIPWSKIQKISPLRIKYDDFINLGSHGISIASNNKNYTSIRGTRYLAYIDDNWKIRFLWTFYSGSLVQDPGDIKDFIPSGVSSVTSFDYYRVNHHIFRFMGVSSEVDNAIWTKDILIYELHYLDDNAMIDSGVTSCVNTEKYFDNRCYGC